MLGTLAAAHCLGRTGHRNHLVSLFLSGSFQDPALNLQSFYFSEIRLPQDLPLCHAEAAVLIGVTEAC